MKARILNFSVSSVAFVEASYTSTLASIDLNMRGPNPDQLSDSNRTVTEQSFIMN